MSIITQIQMGGQQRQFERDLEEIHNKYTTMKCLLRTHLAIRCYLLEHQQLPETLSQLVPGHLPQMPKDPLGKGLLVYHRQNDVYVLYSVGLNGVDDGGIAGEGDKSGDLLLEPSEEVEAEKSEGE